jgi:hypothetical protein
MSLSPISKNPATDMRERETPPTPPLSAPEGRRSEEKDRERDIKERKKRRD